MMAKKTRKRRDPETLAPVIEEISRRLQVLRNRRNLSQDDVAKVVSVTQAAVSRWESGEQPAIPSAAELAALADFFEVSTDWITGRSSFEQPLPANQALVDQKLLEAILAVDDRKTLARLIDAELISGTIYSTVPDGAEVVTHAEARRRVEAVDRHVRNIDEKLWRKWARRALSG